MAEKRGRPKKVVEEQEVKNIKAEDVLPKPSQPKTDSKRKIKEEPMELKFKARIRLIDELGKKREVDEIFSIQDKDIQKQLIKRGWVKKL